ncbi:Csu type fimbrial protein [Psychrobacter alimentarius]|uniref:Csu type fimbrial protein n=1 Tax=Psychrobacter TaxID=497 RepID=UPI000BAAFFA0|nr:spore coat protein U domain-containing protein [Psychrobacter sp. JB193]PAT62498.1 hypothetical protein CIK80_07835 [Psychrobacter sp. JB193]
MQFNKTLMTAALLTIGGFASVSASAALDTNVDSSFKVQMTVEKSCTVIAGNNISLSARADAIAPVGNSALSVACSLGTPYSIAMLPTGGASGTGTLKPTDTETNTNTIAYQLATDADGNNVWTAGIGGEETTGGTGTGTSERQDFTVYAKLTGDITTVLPDVYSDTVTVSVAY